MRRAAAVTGLRARGGHEFDFSAMFDRVRHPAKGRHGGRDGAAGRVRLDDGPDRAVDVLRNHARWLAAEQDRLAKLARTVSRTIEELEGGDEVKMDELFDGFDADRQARYEAELVERYGEQAQEHIDEGKRRMKSWTKPATGG